MSYKIHKQPREPLSFKGQCSHCDTGFTCDEWDTFETYMDHSNSPIYNTPCPNCSKTVSYLKCLRAIEAIEHEKTVAFDGFPWLMTGLMVLAVYLIYLLIGAISQ